MDNELIRIFSEVRESFPEVRHKVSLLKPHLELMLFAPSWALTLDEFEKILMRKPVVLLWSDERVYGISAQYRVDDALTAGVLAFGFSELIARERDVTDGDHIDAICVERGFGRHLLHALQNDVAPGMVVREFVLREHLEARMQHVAKLLETVRG